MTYQFFWLLLFGGGGAWREFCAPKLRNNMELLEFLGEIGRFWQELFLPGCRKFADFRQTALCCSLIARELRMMGGEERFFRESGSRLTMRRSGFRSSLDFYPVFCCGLLRRILPAFRAKFALDRVSSRGPAANCARALAECVLARISCSQSTISCSQLTINCSQLTINCSQSTIGCSQSPTLAFFLQL